MEKLYTPKEVAEITGFSIGTVRNYMSDGTIKSVKILGSNRVKESTIRDLIKEKETSK